jgi:diguanylate cyclase (GGDEF)-like protein
MLQESMPASPIPPNPPPAPPQTARRAGSPRQAAILRDIARVATEDLELQPMLQRITDTMAQRFGWEFVALVRIESGGAQSGGAQSGGAQPEGARFVCEAVSSRLPTEVRVGYSRVLGSGVVGEVAASGRPILLDDVRDFPNYVETLPGALSEVCVPVRHRGQVVALLNVESPRLAAFHDQLGLLETVAEQVAGAIANARLLHRLREAGAALEESNRQLRAANEALQRLSLQDPLTGIANRRRFDQAIASEWRRAIRQRTPLALVLLDIDSFKQFNDSQGHLEGDRCLRQVGALLQTNLQRAGDLAARCGGEEFAVLLAGCDALQAEAIAETLRRRVEELRIAHPASATGPWLTVSAGVAAMVPAARQEPASLTRSADGALYAAKRSGRNRVVRAPDAPPASPA